MAAGFVKFVTGSVPETGLLTASSGHFFCLSAFSGWAEWPTSAQDSKVALAPPPTLTPTSSTGPETAHTWILACFEPCCCGGWQGSAFEQLCHKALLRPLF